MRTIRPRAQARPEKICGPARDGKFVISLHEKAIAFSRTNCAFQATNRVSDLSSFGGTPLKAVRKSRSGCRDQFPVFELVLKKRGRTWRWGVCTTEGAVVMDGSESSRPAAKYKADRALFLLLLSAPYRSIQAQHVSKSLNKLFET